MGTWKQQQQQQQRRQRQQQQVSVVKQGESPDVQVN